MFRDLGWVKDEWMWLGTVLRKGGKGIRKLVVDKIIGISS